MLDTPVERITESGVKTTDAEYAFDIIIYATGFDAVTGSLDRIDIKGTGGQKLKDKWADGPTTFVGVLVDEFPNMFMVVGPHTALGNIPRSIEYNVEWIASLIGHLKREDLSFADARPEAVAEWTSFVAEKAEGLLSNEIDSWMTGVNLNVAGKQVRRLMRYSGSAPDYRDWCDREAAAGYPGLQVS